MPVSHQSIAFHTIVLSLLHLLVDGVCASCVMLTTDQMVSGVEAGGIIVLYNVLAFGSQPLTGRWVDTNGACGRNLKLAIALLAGGALISLLSVSFKLLTTVVSATLLGIGNSLFHVYGGKYVAIASHNDIRVMGIFVSTGAVGLATGLSFYSPVLLVVFLLAILALSVLHTHNARTVRGGSSIPACTEKSRPIPVQSAVPVMFLSCLMFVVAGRAFIGESVPSLRTWMPSLGAPLTMIAVSVVVMAGKAAGGFLSKTWGVQRVFFVSMLLCAATFLMCPWHNAFVLLTLLLVNISMPCTLYWATKAVPGREGLTFGLLAMALLPGFFLGQLFKGNVTCHILLVPLMATILLESFLLLCMREYRWRVLAISVVFNIFTNVPLNAFVMTYHISSPPYIIGMECLVVAVEFAGYWLVLRNCRIAFKYSILCNSFSFLVGCIFQFFIS